MINLQLLILITDTGNVRDNLHWKLKTKNWIVSGQNLVPEPADEAEEEDEGGADTTRSNTDRGEHITIVSWPQRLQW